MNRVFIYFARFAVILGGYGFAAIAASAFLNLMLVGHLDLTPDETAGVVTGSIWLSIPFLALFVGYFAFMPSLPVILLSEILGWRSWLFHALAGAGIAAFVVLGFFGVDLGSQLGQNPRLALSLIGGGIVGGAAYWLVAGRYAGEWRARAARPTAVAPGPAGDSG
jgi:hypothetical protein